MKGTLILPLSCTECGFTLEIMGGAKNNNQNNQNASDVMKQLHLNHLEVLDKVESMNGNTLEKVVQSLMQYVDKTDAKRQSIDDLKFESINKEFFYLNLRMDKVTEERDNYKKKTSRRQCQTYHKIIKES